MDLKPTPRTIEDCTLQAIVRDVSRRHPRSNAAQTTVLVNRQLHFHGYAPVSSTKVYHIRQRQASSIRRA